MNTKHLLLLAILFASCQKEVQNSQADSAKQITQAVATKDSVRFLFSQHTDTVLIGNGVKDCFLSQIVTYADTSYLKEIIFKVRYKENCSLTKARLWVDRHMVNAINLNETQDTIRFIWKNPLIVTLHDLENTPAYVYLNIFGIGQPGGRYAIDLVRAVFIQKVPDHQFMRTLGLPEEGLNMLYQKRP